MVSQNQLFRTGPLASVLAKIGVAITGGGLILFVLAHMFGNLQVFLGPDTFNLYAYKMQHMVLLWPARIGLLAIFVAHMGLVFLLTRQNSVARPVGYASYEPIQSTVASRYMLQTGIVILLFVVYHLLHFTLHAVHYPLATDPTSPRVLATAKSVSATAKSVSAVATRLSAATESPPEPAGNLSDKAENLSDKAESLSDKAESLSADAAKSFSAAAKSVSAAAKSVSAAIESQPATAENLSAAAENLSAAAENLLAAAENLAGEAENLSAAAAHITYAKPPYTGQQMHNAYDMVIYSFQRPVVALIYVLAQLFLAAHLWHGGQSLFQTIGMKNENRRALLTRVGPLLAIVVLIGNCSIPIAVLLNILQASSTA